MRIRKILVLSIIAKLFTVTVFSLIPFSSELLTRKLATAPEIKRAKDILIQRTEIGIEQTKRLIEIALHDDMLSLFEDLSSSKGDVLLNNGLAIFLFEDDELKFWTENLDIQGVQEYSARLVKVQNTWCISYWIGMDNFKEWKNGLDEFMESV